MKKIIKFQNGQVELDLSYFSYYLYDQLYFYSEKLVKEFGEPRKTDSELTERHYQIAGALQAITEEVLEKCLNHLYEIVGSKNVVVSGGVFMNSVFNGKITQRTRFEDMFISSCPDDSGASIGAALYVYNIKAKDAKREVQSHNYYGPEFTNDEIKDILKKYKIVKEYKTNVEEYVAKAIASGKMVGWFQGRMEFGQRALGNRSILCDPRDPKMKDKINSAVKYRESFRPFAPSILEEYKLEYFDMPRNVSVPFMERVYVINNEKQKTIPAVTHIDGTGRLQTVRKEDNPRYYRLIQEFQKITGIPVVLNTSFNLNGEPIVCTPTDAIRTFYSCGLDMLVLGNYVIEKKMKENQTTHE
jgi:carbamoyltransferase